jgi:hypothetical protein
MGYNADAAVTHARTRNMIEPEQWNSALSSITGTLVRGTERISSNALLNLLEVGPDPVIRGQPHVDSNGPPRSNP